jgi:hypothetical protein
MIQSRDKQLIGWREYISFPDWGVEHIRAKTDTGAKTSAVDVASIRETKKNQVIFDLIIHDKHRDRHKEIRCPIARRSRVKSSNGKSEERLFVKTRLRIGAVEKEVEIGLVCRKNMLCRALIGRSSLEKDFLIDPTRKYIQGNKNALKTRTKAPKPSSR